MTILTPRARLIVRVVILSFRESGRGVTAGLSPVSYLPYKARGTSLRIRVPVKPFIMTY